MNLLAAIQTYPAFKNLDKTAVYAAYFTSASYKTMKGSEPPNSITHFFKFLPANSAIFLPALVLPVKLTP